MASVSALRQLLEPTSLPPELVDDVLSDANTLWLLGVADELVAGELVLCHPPLGPDEVRAVVNETDHPGLWRITVVTRDRPGLLAGAGAILTGSGLSVVDVAATVLGHSRLAMQRLTVSAPGRVAVDDESWRRLGRRLRDGLADPPAGAAPFTPRRPVQVEVQPQGSGRAVVTMEAPDQAGLLHALGHWLEAAGCNIEAGRAGVEGTVARGVFIVAGPVDTDALCAALGGPAPVGPAGRLVAAGAGLAGGLAGGVVRTACGAAATVLRTIGR